MSDTTTNEENNNNNNAITATTTNLYAEEPESQIKKKESANQTLDTETDLLDLNPEQEQEVTEDGALKQEGEEEFNPEEYGGFNTEAWNRYFGAINDKRQSRSASLALLSSYTVRYNSAPPNSPYPDFNRKALTLKYFPISKKLWESRRRDLAEIEDMEREVQLQATRLAEIQESLRLRIFSRNKKRGMITNREDPDKAQLEEIQHNMKMFAEFQSNIGTKLAKKKQESDTEAFGMYFHKPKEIYDQIMNEDVDDILRACDWKQIQGPANLRLLKPSSSRGVSQGIS